MHTFNNVALLAVLSYIAMIGATPLGNRVQAPAAQALDRRGMYVPFKNSSDIKRSVLTLSNRIESNLSLAPPTHA